MRKFKMFICSIFTFLLFTTPVFADGTKPYYIEANIKSNGDMEVRELKVLSGDYNGFSTNLRYKNNSLKTFSGIKEDFEGSSIYNGSNLVDLKVYDVILKNISFDLLHQPYKEFELVAYAEKGEYGKYTKEITNGGVDLLIYMPSSYNRGSLVTYTVKDAVVVHNDVAELAWDFIGSDYQEEIKNLRVVVNLPGESNELRVFSHGPLNGNNEILSKSSVEMTYDRLPMGNSVDMRVVFDKSLVSDATKLSNIDGLNYILEVEKDRAEKANELREEARKQERIMNIVTIVFKVSSVIWLIGLIVILYKIYQKYDKEHKSTFNAKYFRDFPAEYGPEVVSYLMYKDINNNSFGASVLELIRKKVLILEEIQVEKKTLIGSKTKKDYKLTKNNEYSVEKLTSSEKILLNLLIDTIGNGSFVTLKNVTDYSKKYTTAQTFMSKYNAWKNEGIMLGENENFYEDIGGAKFKGIMYSIIIFIISVITLMFEIEMGLFYLINIAGVGAIIYFATITKRTITGNEQFNKWNALKNFLVDFSQMNDKQIPEIHLWERYLVYATVFGIADKVQEYMKVKLQDMNYDTTTFTFLYFNDWYFYSTLNKTLTQSISTSQSTITQHEMASSRNSSSSGFGGGSSFGGGGFGGGGSGGGRF